MVVICVVAHNGSSPKSNQVKILPEWNKALGKDFTLTQIKLVSIMRSTLITTTAGSVVSLLDAGLRAISLSHFHLISSILLHFNLEQMSNMSYLSTLKFIRTNLGRKPNITMRQIRLTDDTYDFEAEVYEPKGVDRGTILMLHGMNKQANQDLRLIDVAKSMAAAGFRVVFPSYPIIAQHLIDIGCVDEFAATIRIMTADKTLCPSGQTGVFTASFSGAILFRALGYPDVAEKVSSVCGIGVCCYARTILYNMLNEATDDYYAKCITLKNLHKIAGHLTPTREKAFSLAIDDSFSADSQWTQVRGFVETEIPEMQPVLRRLIDKVESQAPMSELYEAEIDLLADEFFTPNLSAIRCPISLIHSEGDTVLHTVESEMLFKDLKKAGVSTNLVITPLFDHADFKFSIKYLKQGLQLIHAFHYFFRAV
jgi:hypothetical protein